MTSNKLNVRKTDYERVLLTDVLPYELPILFSNFRLYLFAKKKAHLVMPSVLNALLHPQSEFSIPFDYQIWQGSRNRRTLSVIHPTWQIKFVEFYKQYGEMMLSLCAKSQFSLRFPSRIASYFRDRTYSIEDDSMVTGSVDQDPDPFDDEPLHAASYFYYARYAQLYRFIDSSEYLSLESKFPSLLKFDVQRCFPSIYTHSIGWAVKGKEFSKENISNRTFEGWFDELMRSANYNETNGIVIGPEISRVFAEIVMQQIDLNIERAIADLGIERDEYEIRRYVDDFFVFSKSASITARIYEIAKEKLEEFNFYVNDSKTESLALPFITPQTIAKRDVQEILQETVLSWLNYLKKLCKSSTEEGLTIGEVSRLRLPFKLSAEIMRDLKAAVKRGGVGFEVVTSYALGSITQSLYRLHKALKSGRIPESRQMEFQNMIVATVEVSFFLYAMDFRVRTTYFITQLMLIVTRIAERDNAFREYVVANMRAHVERILFSLRPESPPGVEVLNLLVGLKAMCPTDLLSSDSIRKILACWSRAEGVIEFDRFSYFDYVVLLYYVGGSSGHEDLRQQVEFGIVARFQRERQIGLKAELALLFIDVMNCPYVSTATKTRLVDLVANTLLRRSAYANETGELVNFCRKNIGFTNWSRTLNIEKLLMRKQLNPPY